MTFEAFVCVDIQVREKKVKRVLEERCDGGFNILHIAVAMSVPQSNKDNEGLHLLSSGKIAVKLN
jgi:N-acetylglutamate synthase/N-acetylornithine aminotransferase